jgi:hypothetical protein
MGILDDAIREHLELKRQHGVPEEEVQRQEEEALGPARRDVAQQPEETELAPGQPVGDEAGDAAATAVAEPEPPAAEQDTELFDMERDVAEAPAEAPAEPAAPAADAEPVTPVPEPPPPAPEPPAPAGEETAVHEVPDAAEPARAEPTPVEPPPVEPPPVEPAPDTRLGDTQPHGFEAVEDELDEEAELPEESELADGEEDDLLASDPEQDELDVLEDTPDFLQETPEHDRLWFEQKPPRDFDFD